MMPEDGTDGRPDSKREIQPNRARSSLEMAGAVQGKDRSFYERLLEEARWE